MPEIPEYGSGWGNSPYEPAGDYSNSKAGLGKVYPDNQVVTSWEATEPLISPEKLKSVFLFGLPLVSSVPDPITGKPEMMDETQLQNQIIEAVSLAELESGLHIFPKQFREKLAFDKAEYDAFGYIMLKKRPVSSIEGLTVTPSDEKTVYSVPLEWVDVGNLHTGQLNMIPLTIALKTGTVVPLTTSAGGAMFLSIFGNRPWIPSLFECLYTAGFPRASLPKVINQYVGTVAAMEILSLLATTNSRSTSSSLSFDGISQSISTPGPEVYLQRLKELGQKRQWLVRKLQRFYGLGIMVNNV